METPKVDCQEFLGAEMFALPVDLRDLQHVKSCAPMILAAKKRLEKLEFQAGCMEVESIMRAAPEVKLVRIEMIELPKGYSSSSAGGIENIITARFNVEVEEGSFAWRGANSVLGCMGDETPLLYGKLSIALARLDKGFLERFEGLDVDPSSIVSMRGQLASMQELSEWESVDLVQSVKGLERKRGRGGL